MKKRIIYAVLTSGMIILVSLTLKAYNKWTRYVVEAGYHSCAVAEEPLSDPFLIEFTFRTNPTWYYNIPERSAWNKIRGLSNGHNHENSSAFLTYQCVDDSLLVIGAYCFVNGISPDENETQKIVLDTIDINQKYSCRIIMEDGFYKFYFEDKYWHCPSGEELGLGYRINPNVDPLCTLDHDWMIDMLDKQ